MERPFRSVLDYIRNFFSIPPLETDRKRRAPAPIVDVPVRAKISRYSPYTKSPTRIIPIEREQDDKAPWLPLKTQAVKRSPHRINQRIPMKPLRLEDVVVIDDVEDINEIKKPGGLKFENKGRLRSFTSTPADKGRIFAGRNGFENGSDDIILVKTTKSPKEKQLEAKSAGFDYIQPKSSIDKPLFSIGTIAQNGTNSNYRLKCMRSSLNGSRGPSTMDYSFRLEDKMQYKKLLEQASNNSSLYHTPVGKSFTSYDFSNSSDKTKSPLFGLDKSQEKKETTKDRIIKVLDGLENDAVVVKDSDSEGSVIMVNPPSPKPDIRVDPINSFKKVVDTSLASNKDWLNQLVESHKQSVAQRQREIDNLRQCSQKSAEINKDINLELLRRKVNDCLQLKVVILPEIVLESEAELPELTEKQIYMVQRAFRGDPNEVLARKFNLNITRRDLLTLAGLNWLNDEVINFYMNLIIERGKDSKWPKSYAFNTFFYPKLLKDGPQSLRRWTKRIDIFSHDLVCVPIHLGMHWCMAVVDFRDKFIRYYDSMGSPNNRCLEALRKYLETEHMDKKNSRYDTNDFTLENMTDIPQQMNGSDCGMFACTFAEFLTRNAKITFKQEDMPYLRKKMVVEIMSGDLLMK